MPISLDVNTLVQMAAKAPDNTSIIVKNGGFQSVGKVGAFFASKTQCRLASQALLEGIRQQYGDGVADALAPDLRVLITKGKPLSARTVNDLVGKADDMAKWMKPHNVMLAQKFNAGSGINGITSGDEAPIPGNTVNLDTVFSEACAKHGLNAADPELKSLLGKMVLDMAEKSKTMVSVTAMRDFVLNNAVKAHNTLLASRFESSGEKSIALDLPDASIRGMTPAQKDDISRAADQAIQRAIEQADKPLSYIQLHLLTREAGVARIMELCGQKDAAVNALADAHHLNPSQKAELSGLVDMVLQMRTSQAPEEKRQYDIMPSVASLAAEIRDAKLPGITSFLTACGIDGGLTGAKRELMENAANSPYRADFAMIMEMVDADLATGYLALQNMHNMRTLQPQGPLTRETVWQACFNESLPDALRKATPLEMHKAMQDAMFGQIMANVSPGQSFDPTLASILMGSCLKTETVMDFLKSPSITLGLDDFVTPLPLTSLSRLPDLEEAEAAIAHDLHRRMGEDPIIAFSQAGAAEQPGDVIHLRDTSHLTAEETHAYHHDQPSPISHALVEKARELCGGNEAQLRQVVMSMGQSGAYLMRSVSPAVLPKSVRADPNLAAVNQLVEHSPVNLHIRKEANGDVTMRFTTPPGTTINMDFTYTVAPDGRGILSQCSVQQGQLTTTVN